MRWIHWRNGTEADENADPGMIQLLPFVFLGASSCKCSEDISIM